MRPAAKVTDLARAPVPPHQCCPDYRGARIVASHGCLWTGVSALHLDLRSDGTFEAIVPAGPPRLFFTIEALGGQVRVLPAAQHARSSHTGPVSIAPAGTAVRIQGRARRFRQLLLSFDATAFGDGIDPAAVFQPRFMFADSRLVKLCLLLADECVSPAPMDHPFGDSLIRSLLLVLSRDPADRSHSAGGLAPWQLRRLEAFIDAHLGDDLSLDRLAHEAGVSRSHFSRVFKRTVGQSPIEWVRSKRIERAKHLLAEGVLTVADIAITTGFADQAHLTRVFGRLVGVPPAAWRRGRLRGAEDGLGANVQNEDKPTIDPTRIDP